MVRSAWVKILAGAGGAALLATAFHAGPAMAGGPVAVREVVADHAQATKPNLAQDGKDLFRGVHFFQGEVAEALVSAGAVTAADDALEAGREKEAVAMVDDLIAAIEKDDPAFFAQLSADLRSGDPYLVEDALTRGSERIQQNLEIVDDGLAEGQCIAVALAIVGFVAVVYSIHTAIALDVTIMAEHIQIMGGELTTQELVAQLTPLLAR